MQARLVFVTVPSMETAEAIAGKLVSERLAACVNVLPGLRSIYRWQGKIEDSTELMLIVKSSAATMPALERRILELHPYDTPEIVALAPAHVEERYLAWLLEGSSPA